MKLVVAFAAGAAFGAIGMFLLAAMALDADDQRLRSARAKDGGGLFEPLVPQGFRPTC